MRASPASAPEPVVSLAMSPHGVLYLHEAPAEHGTLPAALRRRVERAFAAGPGPGLLHLGAREPATALPPVLAFWRDFGRSFVAAVCAPPDSVPPPPGPEALARTAGATPPMLGGESVTADRL